MCWLIVKKRTQKVRFKGNFQEMIMGQKINDSNFCDLRDFDRPKVIGQDQSQGALIRKQPTMLCDTCIAFYCKVSGSRNYLKDHFSWWRSALF